LIVPEPVAAPISCSGLDPTEDTESSCDVWNARRRSRCSGLDPTEDTESFIGEHFEAQFRGVAVGSIRPRILKGWSASPVRRGQGGCSGLDPTEDTERARVGSTTKPMMGCSGLDPTEDTESPMYLERVVNGSFKSCSGLDPTEDTERTCSPSSSTSSLTVAVGSIRPRILKVLALSLRQTDPLGCSGLDPTEDTERLMEYPSTLRRDGGCSGLDPTEDTESAIEMPFTITVRSCCSGLDPTEDTERPPASDPRGPRAGVAVGSIRPRILKADWERGCS